jgi:ubiquinone/menaquinone biosynthesis C-methylase UbiE
LNNLTVIEKNENTPLTDKEFAKLYFLLRKKEGRIYSDEEVSMLPSIHTSHQHYKEWGIRKNSCRALVSYIKHKDSSILSILEVGCGNGWLAAQIAKEVDVDVTGIDINVHELEQARRVFHHVPGLSFMPGSLQSGFLKDKKFDMIIFAASIQYFSSLKQTINTAIEHLTLLGEVHIMDSPFYQQQELEAARQRTKDHYQSIGFAEMANNYHHHTITEFEIFQYKILHHPFAWKNKLTIKKNPFYWITIKNRYS